MELRSFDARTGVALTRRWEQNGTTLHREALRSSRTLNSMFPWRSCNRRGKIDRYVQTVGYHVPLPFTEGHV
jgi:hypothetical protein